VTAMWANLRALPTASSSSQHSPSSVTVFDSVINISKLKFTLLQGMHYLLVARAVTTIGNGQTLFIDYLVCDFCL
jgi:hypothetical protein